MYRQVDVCTVMWLYVYVNTQGMYIEPYGDMAVYLRGIIIHGTCMYRQVDVCVCEYTGYVHRAVW